jgi:hypothetical protein
MVIGNLSLTMPINLQAACGRFDDKLKKYFFYSEIIKRLGRSFAGYK